MKNINYIVFPLCTVLLSTGCAFTDTKVVDVRTENKYDTVTEVNNKQKNIPVFSGSWTLNKKLSDNLQEKIKESRQQARSTKGSNNIESRRGGKGGGGKRGGSMKNDSSSGKGTGNSKGVLSQELRAFLMASETLELKHEEPLLTIITKGRQKQRVYTDFRGASVSANGGKNQKVTTAGWEGDALVVETTSNRASYIQRYRLITGTRQLWISTVILIPGLPNPLKFNRIYEPGERKTKEVRIGKGTP